MSPAKINIPRTKEIISLWSMKILDNLQQIHKNVLQIMKSKQNHNWYNRDKIKSQNIEQIMRNNYLSLHISFSWFNQTIWNIIRIKPAIQKSVWSNGERIHSFNLKNALQDFSSPFFLSQWFVIVFFLSNESLSLYLTL